MTDPESSPLPEDTASPPLPHELPPVQPPSAGMIVQLFLIPAVIVAVIVAVYTLFGQMASQELDWRQLVVDVRSENPHVRWRGALGIAQMLDADARKGSESQHLAGNAEIASALSELYQKLIETAPPREEQLKQIEFLSKAIGRLESPSIVLPVLQSGIRPDRDPNVRKHSLIGVTMVAGTQHALGHPLDSPELVDELIAISREQTPLFRHQAAYALGLLPGQASQARLESLLRDPDLMTRVNAAIGQARNNQTQGLVVFSELFEEALQWQLDPVQVRTLEEESAYFESLLMLNNAVKSVDQLREQLTSEEKRQLTEQLRRLAEVAKEPALRSSTLELIQNLQ